MTRMTAIAKRILSQFVHDKRTLALLFLAPLFVLWILSMLLGASSYTPKIAVADLPSDYIEALKKQDAAIIQASETKAMNMLKDGEIDGVLTLPEDSATLQVTIEGSDHTKTAAVLSTVAGATSEFSKNAQDQMQQNMGIKKYIPIQDTQTNYLHGSDGWDNFDFYGPTFIGLFIFIFTFLTSGMSLVNEKSAGTMSRFLATPVKSWEILGGYSMGFGVFSLVQIAVIVIVGLKFIGFPNEGNVAFVVLIAVSLAIASVTFGLLVSGLASSAFQVIQLMLVFVVPQILLCGLFDLSNTPGWMQVLSNCLPLTYGVDAMKEVMLKGSGIDMIWKDLLVVWGFTIVFFTLAAVKFKKKRAR